MLNILNRYKYVLLTIFLAITAICITFYHNIGLIIDCGREAYYPQEILNGKVLYKDLFNIYAPFAYLFNAFLYKIFGINLSVLCISGACCAFGIVAGIFLLTKELFNDKLAFYNSFFAIITGITSVYVFNYVFPYAFGMTYGFCAFIFSLLFLIYYINFERHVYIYNIYIYASLFLAGLAICCKYEFILYLLVYIPVFIRKKTSFLILFKGLLCFGLIPEMCIAFLLLQGLRLHDIINSIQIVLAMSQTQTLKYFYIHSGVFPHRESVVALAVTFLALFIPFFIYMLPVIFKDKIKNPVLGLIFTYGAFCIMLLFKNNTAYDIFMSLPFVLLLVAIFNYKKLFNNLNVLIVVLSIFLVSLKSFWGIILNSYGTYYLPILLIAIAICFKDKLTEKEWDYTGFYVLILSLLIGFYNFNFIKTKSNLIQTPKGKIYTEKKYETTNKLLEFIEKNTQKTDKIIIFPEGMMINFLSDRKTDDFYNSMIPLYEETFGVETYIEHFKKSMPEYIIFNSWNSSDYYFSIICEDYGFKFCEFVQNFYEEKIKLSGDFSYIIYKKK